MCWKEARRNLAMCKLASKVAPILAVVTCYLACVWVLGRVNGRPSPQATSWRADTRQHTAAGLFWFPGRYPRFVPLHALPEPLFLLLSRPPPPLPFSSTLATLFLSPLSIFVPLFAHRLQFSAERDIPDSCAYIYLSPDIFLFITLWMCVRAYDKARRLQTASQKLAICAAAAKTRKIISCRSISFSPPFPTSWILRFVKYSSGTRRFDHNENSSRLSSGG